jgi:DNA-binding CsgD family transcriptional regulator
VQLAAQVATGLKSLAGFRDRWRYGRIALWGHYAEPRVTVVAELAEPYALMVEGDWERAAAAWQKCNAPYERALALASGPEEALRESLAILEKLRAGPLAAIVRRRLRELGARRIPRGPRLSTRGNPGGLTAREAQVLTLLVRGYTTNDQLARQLHVSAKTVDHHVCSILRKLEVRSRAQAVSAAFGRGILKMNGNRAEATRASS